MENPRDASTPAKRTPAMETIPRLSLKIKKRRSSTGDAIYGCLTEATPLSLLAPRPRSIAPRSITPDILIPMLTTTPGKRPAPPRTYDDDVDEEEKENQDPIFCCGESSSSIEPIRQAPSFDPLHFSPEPYARGESKYEDDDEDTIGTTSLMKRPRRKSSQSDLGLSWSSSFSTLPSPRTRSHKNHLLVFTPPRILDDTIGFVDRTPRVLLEDDNNKVQLHGGDKAAATTPHTALLTPVLSPPPMKNTACLFEDPVSVIRKRFSEAAVLEEEDLFSVRGHDSLSFRGHDSFEIIPPMGVLLGDDHTTPPAVNTTKHNDFRLRQQRH